MALRSSPSMVHTRSYPTIDGRRTASEWTITSSMATDNVAIPNQGVSQPGFGRSWWSWNSLPGGSQPSLANEGKSKSRIPLEFYLNDRAIKLWQRIYRRAYLIAIYDPISNKNRFLFHISNTKRVPSIPLPRQWQRKSSRPIWYRPTQISVSSETLAQCQVGDPYKLGVLYQFPLYPYISRFRSGHGWLLQWFRVSHQVWSLQGYFPRCSTKHWR